MNSLHHPDTRIIVVGGLSGPEGGDSKPSGPWRLRLARLFNPASVATTAHRKLAGYLLAGLRAGGRDRLGNKRRVPSYRTARSYLYGALTAPRTVSRVHCAQKSFRSSVILAGPSLRFGFHQSSPVALASHEQEATGVVGNVRKSLGEIQNA